MNQPPFVIERFGRIQDLDRSLDIAYWQRLGPEAIFAAAWQMAIEAHSRGSTRADQLRLQRTVEHFGKKPG